MEALERLYRVDGPTLERALILFARNREVARDAVAEAYAQAIQGRQRLRDPRRWIWSAAFRIASGELKARGRWVPLSEDGIVDAPADLVDLVRALGRLSPKQRASLVLRYYVGYGTREIARIIDSTPGAVTVHLAVGRRRLRELMEEHDG